MIGGKLVGIFRCYHLVEDSAGLPDKFTEVYSLRVEDAGNFLWVDTKIGPEVPLMRLGDSIWWQSRSIFWTPKGEGAAEALEEHSIKFKTDSQGRPYDVYLPRVGLSYTDKDRENGWYSSI